MLYSLDTFSKYGKSDGTSVKATEMIMQWLGYHTKGDFAFKKCEYLKGEQVHLGKNNKIMSCIKRDGIALMSVRIEDEYHFVLLLGADKSDSSKLLFFDPYYSEEKYTGNDSVHIEILKTNDKQGANRRVSRERLNCGKHEFYSMGPVDERECCLLERLGKG
jgi:hypothetical protein